MSTRSRAFYAAAGMLLILCGIMGVWERAHGQPGIRIAGFVLLFAVGIAVTLLWPRELSRRSATAGLLLLALAARVALLPHPVDSDANRYLWEGRLVRAGESPYAHVAAGPEWEHLRDAYWSGMNQKGLRTIYPPLAEWTFTAVGALWYHPLALKLLFIGFDIGVVALLVALLARRAMPLRFAGLYAFNPVPLVGFAGQAHFDAMLLFFVLLALWLRDRGRPAWSWVALGCAVQLKLVAIVLAPLLARRGGWRTAWAAALVVALPFLPYLADVRAWLEAVQHFGADLGFNGSLHALLWMALGDRPSAATVCAVLLVAWAVIVAWVHGDDLPRGVFWMLGSLVVLSPIVHYWYLSWALVLVPLFPSLAWLTASGAMALYFLVLSEVRAGRPWGLPPWAQATIWSAFALVLLREVVISLRALHHSRGRGAFPRVHTLAVVVPALNESGTLRACLASLLRQSRAPDEIIVVDGGSTDSTRSIAEDFGATVAVSARGRGRQIATGIAVARADVVLVVHADSLVQPEVAARVIEALNANPAAVGGAVGQRFDGSSLKLRAIELLNEVRALFFGISFGDQGQFFRRAAMTGANAFPLLPLMEDIEFSLRARAAGPVLYLGGGFVSSDRRWRREHWLTRCLTVLTLTTVYRLRRRDGARIAAALYRRYYSGKDLCPTHAAPHPPLPFP